MAKVGRIIGYSALGLVGVSAVAGGAGYLYVSSSFSAAMAQTWSVHDVELPVPWPLTEAEIEALRAERLAALEPEPVPPGEDGADVVLASMEEGTAEPEPTPDPLEGVDLDAIALERAKERGEHLVRARYACAACHGDDFGGGAMVEDGAMGTWLGPNLTSGVGSVTAEYDTADWDRIVRHGVKPDGTAAVMPSDDFTLMSDQELSDIITYVSSLPAVDSEVPAPTFGPISTVLVAVGELTWSAARLDHDKAHPTLPPKAEATAAFGAHLAGVCYGCHRSNLDGGKIKVGPPDWPPASNLTATNERLHGYTFEEFDALMRTGIRPDGSQVLAPMSDIMPVTRENTDTEMRALYAYITSLEAKPTGE